MNAEPDCRVCLVILNSDFPFRTPRIILRVDVFEAKRPDRGHLGDVLARFRPMKVGRVAGEDDYGAGWKALDLPWPEPGLANGVEALACLPE